MGPAAGVPPAVSPVGEVCAQIGVASGAKANAKSSAIRPAKGELFRQECCVMGVNFVPCYLGAEVDAMFDRPCDGAVAGGPRKSADRF
jgi:hypothetical protein